MLSEFSDRTLFLPIIIYAVNDGQLNYSNTENSRGTSLVCLTQRFHGGSGSA
jgi:hypothetical protein